MADETTQNSDAAAGAAGSESNESAATQGGEKTTPLGAQKTNGDAAKAGAEGANDESQGDAGAEGGQGEGDGTPAPVDLAKLVLPEGFTADEGWMGKFGEHPLIAKASQEEAQSMVEMAAEFVSGVKQQVEQQVVAQQNQRVATWTKAIAEHEFVVAEGGLEKVVPLALAARDAFFGDLPEFKDLIQALNESGLGAHPAMVVGLARAAKALELAEGVPLGGGKPKQASSGKRIEDKMFPNYAPGGRYA